MTNCAGLNEKTLHSTGKFFGAISVKSALTDLVLDTWK